MSWSRVAWLLLLLLPSLAVANPCGDAEALEALALKRELPEADRTCLEASVLGGAAFGIRTVNSFVLIVDAYARGNLDQYATLLRRHLTEVHPGDAEVAFMYADHLNGHSGASDEVLKWAKVAMDGHRRWLHNRANHDKMMKHLWELRVEVSMLLAVEAASAAQQDPGEASQQRLEAYRRQARVTLVEAAPCLHYGECGPYYEVEVEGYADCDDLESMEIKAQRGRLTDEEESCLRSKYRRSGAPKSRILAILADQADAESASRTEDSWKDLLGWQGGVSGMDDPLLAARYADFLLDHDWARTQEALSWADEVLGNESDVLSGRAGREAVARLHRLRIMTVEQQVVEAQNLNAGASTAETTAALSDARARLKEARASYDAFCRDNKAACKAP